MNTIVGWLFVGYIWLAVAVGLLIRVFRTRAALGIVALAIFSYIALGPLITGEPFDLPARLASGLFVLALFLIVMVYLATRQRDLR